MPSEAPGQGTPPDPPPSDGTQPLVGGPPPWGDAPPPWGDGPAPWERPGPAISEVPPDVDGEPRHTSGLTAAVAMGGVLVGLALLPVEGAILGSTGGGAPDEPGFFGWLFPLLMILGAGREVVSWWARTYRVTEDRLVIDEGILTRHHRVVPFERVQQVDISRSLGQQVFGLAALSIATAGEAGTTTVNLRLLDHRRALGLRTHVLRRRAELQERRRREAAAAEPTAEGGPVPGAGPDTSPAAPAGAWYEPAPPVPLAEVGPARLAVAVLTRSSVLVVPLVLALAVFAAWVASVRFEGGLSTTGIGVAAVTGFLFLAFAGAVHAVGQIVGLWGFRAELVGDDLHLRHGLFDVRHVTVPRPRVQVVRIEDNPIQRTLGFAAVTLRSARGVHGAQATATVFRIPYVARGELARTVRLILGAQDPPPGDRSSIGSPEDLPELTRRGDAAARRSQVRGAVAGAVAGSVGLTTGAGGFLLVVVGGALGALWGIVSHSWAGWRTDEEVVLLARGVFSHRLDVVPLARIQSASTRSNPLQRRAGLATFRVDVAGGHAPTLWDLDSEVADRLRSDLPRASRPTGRP